MPEALYRPDERDDTWAADYGRDAENQPPFVLLSAEGDDFGFPAHVRESKCALLSNEKLRALCREEEERCALPRTIPATLSTHATRARLV